MTLSGASCDKKSAAGPDEASDVVRAMDEAKSGGSQPAGSAKAVDKTPIEGVDVQKLDEKKTERFYGLVGSLQSPCGKAESLRVSLTSDKDCKRASFAARYVIEMLSDELADAEIKQLYELHYKKQGDKKTFNLEGTPHSGPPDAPVKLVEYYDYGCGACKQFAPVLKEAVASFPDDAVLFYKQFPLPAHVNSKPAAQAALAAREQGKFNEMHELLFEKSPMHGVAELRQYAQSLGLDMKKFEADFAAALPRVEADIAEGDKVGVDSTPTLYINGQMYEGPTHPKYIQMWIEEELAVNR